METKICSKCKRELSSEMFGKYKRTRDGLNYICRDCVKQLNDDNKDKRKEYAKKHYREHKDEVLTAQTKYRKAHLGKFVEYTHLRREREKLLGNTYSSKTWEYTKQYFNNRCCYCGKELPLERDHLIAVINGGPTQGNNIVPACKSCNSSKGVSSFWDWFPKQSFYTVDKLIKILTFLGCPVDEHDLIGYI